MNQPEARIGEALNFLGFENPKGIVDAPSELSRYQNPKGLVMPNSVLFFQAVALFHRFVRGSTSD